MGNRYMRLNLDTGIGAGGAATTFFMQGAIADLFSPAA